MPDLSPRESYGQLFFLDNTIESISPTIDIEIGLAESTANLKLNRNVVLAAGKSFGLIDSILGTPATLTSSNGTLVIAGATGLLVGDIKIFGDTIESSSPGTNIQLGNTSATADLVLNRNTRLATGKSLIFPDNTTQTTAAVAQVNSDWNSTTGKSQILNKPDLTQYNPPTAVRWSPVFQATGLTFTGTGATYPTYNSYYVKYGQMVTFWIEVDMTTVTNFGTGQYLLQLPFAPLAGTMNHFSGWCNVDPTQNPDNVGHAILNIDHLAGTQTLDMHYLKQSGGANSPIMEAIFKQGSPVTLTTSSTIYVNGTYIAAS